jgi:hypothetical protein
MSTGRRIVSALIGMLKEPGPQPWADPSYRLQAATHASIMGPETRRNVGLVECLQPDRRVEVTLAGGS